MLITVFSLIALCIFAFHKWIISFHGTINVISSYDWNHKTILLIKAHIYVSELTDILQNINLTIFKF